MTSTLDLLRHPSKLLSHSHSRHRSHGGEISGVLTALIFIGLFVWLFPELRRYVRISRM